MFRVSFAFFGGKLVLEPSVKELLQEELFICDLILILSHVVAQLNVERGLIFYIIDDYFDFSFAKNLWLLSEELLANICFSERTFELTNFALIFFMWSNSKYIAQKLVSSFGWFAVLFTFLLILVILFSPIEEICTRLVVKALKICCWIRKLVFILKERHTLRLIHNRLRRCSFDHVKRRFLGQTR